MDSNQSPIFCEIDLDKNGKHHGFLRLPHSVHRSAYGWIPVPITSVRNGDGPVVLLMAGNHGDEYEGQVALCHLIRELVAEDINGQIILLPMANFPAAKAGRRTSPIDDGNLNRSFPGSPSGNPTEVIAHYIESELLRRADYLLDIHSGGSSLLYIPSLLMDIDTNPDQHQANLSLVQSMGFPQALLFQSSKMQCYSSSAAKRNDCVAITAEVAGGGTIDPAALQLLHQGLANYLAHVGITSTLAPDDEDIEEDMDIDPSNHQLEQLRPIENKNKTTELLQIAEGDSLCCSYDRGLFEPLVNLGDHVVSGQLAGLIHDPETPREQPTRVTFNCSGKVVCKRVPARVERGDCLFEVAERLVR